MGEKWLQKSHRSCISPIGFTSSVFRHLDEFGIDGLVSFTEDRDKVLRLLKVVGCEESVGCSRFLTACRAPNAVNVVLRVVGVIEVNYKLDILDICGNHCDAVWWKGSKVCTPQQQQRDITRQELTEMYALNMIFPIW